MLWVLVTESVVYTFSAWYAFSTSQISYLSCNHPFQLFFLATGISAIAAMPIGIYSTEIIAAGT